MLPVNKLYSDLGNQPYIRRADFNLFNPVYSALEYSM